MNGQANKESDKLGKRSEWLERGIWFGGGLVVAGLLAEYGPELGIALAKHEAPKPVTIGGFLVIIGVAAEVILGIVLATTTKRQQAIAQARIAETLERASNAEQAAAEANLARARLERWILGRDFTDEEQKAFVAKLSEFAGTRISVRAFPADHEAVTFAHIVCAALSESGWHTQLLPSHLFTHPGSIQCGGFSLVSTPDDKTVKAGFALVFELARVAGGGAGPVTLLPDTEGPRLELVIQGPDIPPRSSFRTD